MRALAAAAVLLAFAVQASANSSFRLFPESEKVFPQLTADPRRIGLGASYYRLDGKDRSDIALGHSWGLARWHTNGGSLNSFETVDFIGNLPIAVRHGDFSARMMIFHESSHLGDDYIRATKDSGFRYSLDGLRAHLSIEPLAWARVYVGGMYLLHTVPNEGRRAGQAGVELVSRPIDHSKKYPFRLFVAQDLQFKEMTGYGANWHSIAGVSAGFDGAPRSMRFYVGHFDGRSPFGQMYKRRERYNEVVISFHF